MTFTTTPYEGNFDLLPDPMCQPIDPVNDIITTALAVRLDTRPTVRIRPTKLISIDGGSP